MSGGISVEFTVGGMPFSLKTEEDKNGDPIDVQIRALERESTDELSMHTIDLSRTFSYQLKNGGDVFGLIRQFSGTTYKPHGLLAFGGGMPKTTTSLSDAVAQILKHFYSDKTGGGKILPFTGAFKERDAIP